MFDTQMFYAALCGLLTVTGIFAITFGNSQTAAAGAFIGAGLFAIAEAICQRKP